MKLSSRIKKMQFSPIRKLEFAADEARKNGIEIIHLNIGQPDIKTPKKFHERLKQFDEEIVAYKPSNGTMELKETFVDYFNKINYNVTTDNIMITTGASEALLFIFAALCDVGDEILTTDPYYGNYKGFAESNGVELTTFKTKEENNFGIPSEENIEKAITTKTRAILYSNPSNPTGAVYSKEEINRICNVAKKHDLFIISDEVYREFIYDDLEFFSPIYNKEVEERVIVVDSVSKRYSACGVRIGALLTKNEDVIMECSKMSQARLSSATVEQYAAVGLFRHEGEFLVDTKNEYEKRRNVLCQGLSEIDGVTFAKPRGAFYCIVDLPVDNSEKFAKFMLQNFSYKGKTVMVAPAEGFFMEEGQGNTKVRISYCVSCEKIKMALEIIERALIEYNKL